MPTRKTALRSPATRRKRKTRTKAMVTAATKKARPPKVPAPKSSRSRSRSMTTRMSGPRHNPTAARPDLALDGHRCPMCGQQMTSPEDHGTGRGGRGRPRVYDTPECRKLASLIGLPDTVSAPRADATGELSTYIKLVTDRALPEARLGLRRRMMVIANSFAWNKGVASQSVQRRRGLAGPAALPELERRLARELERLDAYRAALQASGQPAVWFHFGDDEDATQVSAATIRTQATMVARTRKALDDLRATYSGQEPQAVAWAERRRMAQGEVTVAQNRLRKAQNDLSAAMNAARSASGGSVAARASAGRLTRLQNAVTGAEQTLADAQAALMAIQ